MIKTDRADSAARAEAENAAIDALGFIAGSEELLKQFVSVSGIAPETLRQAAAAPGFLAAVLGFLLNHEPDLLAFCAASRRKPEAIARAFAALPGGGQISR